jgi:hypothetical protein
MAEAILKGSHLGPGPQFLSGLPQPTWGHVTFRSPTLELGTLYSRKGTNSSCRSLWFC